MSKKDNRVTDAAHSHRRADLAERAGASESDGPISRQMPEKQPNTETLEALRELRKGGGTRLTGGIRDLVAELNAEDVND
jgi:hypothetical protein